MFNPHSNSPSPIYVWDLSADQVQEIGSFLDVWLWHLDAEDNVLVTFEIDWDKRPLDVRQTKWTLTGQHLDGKKNPSIAAGSDNVPPNVVPQPRDFGHRTITRLFTRADSQFTLRTSCTTTASTS